MIKRSVVPPIQLARNGYTFTFAGLSIRPLAVTLCFIRFSYKWEGDEVLPPEHDVILLSHDDFNNLINLDKNEKTERRRSGSTAVSISK